MRLRLCCLLCLVCLRPARGLQPPACRLDDTLRGEVADAVSRVLALMPPGDGGTTFTDVVINAAPNAPETLRVDLVSDAARTDARGCRIGPAPATTEVLDEWSVQGVCEAPLGTDAYVRCSSDTLGVLVDEERKGARPSAALLYVLAHELSHVVHHDQGRFGSAAVQIPLDATVTVRTNALLGACRRRDAETARLLALEERADRDALVVLRESVSKAPYRTEGVGLAASNALILGEIGRAAERVQKVPEHARSVRSLPGYLDSPPLPASAAYVRWAAERFLCDVLTGGPGGQTFPLRSDSHPPPAQRLRDISAALWDSLPVAERVPKPVTGSLVEQSNGILGVLAKAFVELDRAQDEFDKEFVDAVCTAAQQGRYPRCSLVSRTPPPRLPSCPRFEANFATRPIPKQSLDIRVTRQGAHIHLDAAVRSAAVLGGQTVWIGTTAPRGYLIVDGDRVTQQQLPCSPAWAAGTPEAFHILCDDPFGVVSVLGDELTQRVGQELRFDGESLSPADVRGGWIGTVDGSLLSTVSLPGSGASTTIVLNNTANSAPAWQAPGCDSLDTGMALWRVARAGVVGTTWGSVASREAAEFDGVAEPLRRSVSDTRLAHATACGPSFFHGCLLCATDRGDISDPFESKGPVGRFTPPRNLARAMALRGRLCGTRNAVYVLTTAGSGPQQESVVYALPSGRRSGTVVLTDPRTDADLDCTEDAAVAFVSGDGNSDVVQLEPAGNQRPQ